MKRPSSVTSSDIELLKKSCEDNKKPYIFANLPPKLLDKLLAACCIIKLKQGLPLQVIEEKTENDKTRKIEYIFVILKGHISIRTKEPADSFVGWRSTGQVIGEVSSIADNSQSAEITTTDDSRFLKIPSEVFTKIAARHPSLYLNLCRILAAKLMQERKRSEVIRLPSLQRKVAQTLINIVNEQGFREIRKIIHILSINYKDIGGYGGGTGRNVGSVFRCLKKMRILDFGASKGYKFHKVRIKDLERLKLIAEGALEIPSKKNNLT